MPHNTLLLSLYRAAREVGAEQFLDFALNLLKTAVPFDIARWGSFTRDSGGGICFHFAHLMNDDPESVAQYAQARAGDTAGRWAAEHGGRTGNFHLREVYCRRDQLGMREYVRRFRHEHGLVTSAFRPSLKVGHAISLYGAHQRRPFSERERGTMESLFPHLVEAWSINQALHVDKIRQAADDRLWLIAIADSAGFLYFSEPGLAALLDTEWPGGDQDRLPECALDALIDSPSARYDGVRIVVLPVRVGSFLYLKVRPRTAIDDLSPRLRAVAVRIADGWTHKEIARELHSAPSTVRNQIQAIHDRLDVRNVAQLVAKLK